MRIRRDLTTVASIIKDKIPSLGITKENLFWAYGMVTSRAFGNEDDEFGLAPGIDMMNHRSSSGCPFPVNFQMEFGPATMVSLSRDSLPKCALPSIPDTQYFLQRVKFRGHDRQGDDGNWPCACVLAQDGDDTIALLQNEVCEIDLCDKLCDHYFSHH
eukprot:jgi/Bigna1/60889/fgenesh1_kg.16_\